MIREPERDRRARRGSAAASFPLRLPLGTIDTTKRARIDPPGARARDVDAVERRVSSLEARVDTLERVTGAFA